MWQLHINKTESSSDFNRHQKSLSTFQNIYNTANYFTLSNYSFQRFNWTKCSNVYSNEQNVQMFIQMNKTFKSSLKWTKVQKVGKSPPEKSNFKNRLMTVKKNGIDLKLITNPDSRKLHDDFSNIDIKTPAEFESHCKQKIKERVLDIKKLHSIIFSSYVKNAKSNDYLVSL